MAKAASAGETARDARKMARAARSPRRGGLDCGGRPGAFRPKVDHAKCEGKGVCVAVCPYGVFEVGPIGEADFRALPWLLRLKLTIRGRRTARTPLADACRACGLCVAACPERAIALIETAQ